MLMYIFFTAFVVCLILAALSLRNPAFAFICRTPSRGRGAVAWVALAILFAFAVAWAAPKDEYGNVIIPQDEHKAAVMPDAAAR